MAVVIQARFRRATPIISAAPAEPWLGIDASAIGPWNPPSATSQHASQRVIAVLLASTWVALLTRAGWRRTAPDTKREHIP